MIGADLLMEMKIACERVKPMQMLTMRKPKIHKLTHSHFFRSWITAHLPFVRA